MTEHVGSNKRSVGCREIEFLLPGNNHHFIFIFVLLFLFLCSRKLTKKGAGPGDRGGVALEEHQDTVESRLRGERRNVFVELRATEEDMRGNSSYKVEYPLVTLNVDVIRCKNITLCKNVE